MEYPNIWEKYEETADLSLVDDPSHQCQVEELQDLNDFDEEDTGRFGILVYFTDNRIPDEWIKFKEIHITEAPPYEGEVFVQHFKAGSWRKFLIRGKSRLLTNMRFQRTRVFGIRK